MPSDDAPQVISRAARWAVLLAAFLGLVFDGFELGLMPVASPSVTKDFFGPQFDRALDGKWFAWFTPLHLCSGAAVGGNLLGNLGDRIGRARAMGVSILFYSLFAGLGAFTSDVRANAVSAIRWWVWAWVACGPMALRSWQNVGRMHRGP